MARLDKGDRFSKFSASAWNRVLARSDRNASHDLSSSGGDTTPSASDGVALIVNQTSGYLEPGDVVGLSEPEILPTQLDDFQNTINFKGVLPTEDYRGKWGICLDGAEPQGTTSAKIFGEMWAKITMERAGDTFCDIYPETQSKLRSGMAGAAQILYHFPNGTSYPQDTYAYIRIGHLTGMRCARMTELLDDDNEEATANEWAWNPATEEWEETDVEVNLRSFLRPEGEEIADRTRVHFCRIGAADVIIVNNCEPDPEEEETP